ncbi:MAG TPA: outer-membrane lipoprotein carrier protein LolA [Beijerinckiaceae bacterium]|nr:outer rane lipoprotein carrier protein LolA [Microvirga sp.]HZB39301.1 outer-membrane lipoprotein carrier protein LolA [Beijerinckiaceae bacterium]
MPLSPTLRLAAGLCAFGLAGPASAQVANPLDWLFGRNPPAPTAQEPAPQTPAPQSPAGQPAAPGARSSAQGPRAAQPAAAGMPTTAVLPPKRPAGLASEPASVAGEPAPTATASRPPAPQPSAQAGPPVLAAAAAVAPPVSAEPLNERQIVERANAYFNGISTLVGEFVQTGGDGRRIGGTLYLQRPGRIRFEYESPATIEVVADGNSVAVRDRKLATQDLYTIAQTPLKFLLRERISLGQDIRVTGASVEPEGARLSLEDKSTLGGTSKITLFFDKDLQALKRWRIVDAQGFTTIVELTNLDTARRVDPRLFVINYERMLEPK